MRKNDSLKIYFGKVIIFIFDSMIVFFACMAYALNLLVDFLERTSRVIHHSMCKQFFQQNIGLIKGSANYIYHTPDSKYYDQIAQPIAWFASVAEAEKAGFRAPHR